jgi:Cof subfamily protein (haloacid dehalogenase superfamily)
MSSNSSHPHGTNLHAFPYKLAAIDIDQTLVGPDKRIGKANAEAVRRLIARDCRVVLASGRRHDNMLPFHRELGLDGFIVSTQGAVVRHAFNNQVLHEAHLAPRDVAELIREGLRREVTVTHWSRRGVVANEQTKWVRRYVEDCRDPVAVVEPRSMSDRRAEKIVWSAEPAAIASMLAAVRDRYSRRFEVTLTEDYSIEFTNPDATKAAGVAAVADHYGITPDQVIAFGDGNNDVPMLAWAGLGVAMSHGRPAAKTAAKLTAPAGDPESSLARAVAVILGEPAAAAAA